MTQKTFKMKKSRRISLILCFSLLVHLLLFVSCDRRRKVSKYKEKVLDAKTAAVAPAKQEVPVEPNAKAGHYLWDRPEGWSEVPKTSSMRLATFAIKSQGKEAICTIIPLRGEAGGLKANVTRWLGQVTGSTDSSGDTVSQLLDKGESFLTKGQFPAVLIDYTTVTSNLSGQSIMAAVINVHGNSVFIKMTGEKSLLIKNKTKFKALCQSFTLKPGT